jgi:hypothetical protein
MSESNNPFSNGSKVAITAIVTIGIICLACIAAFAGITIAFFINAPW